MKSEGDSSDVESSPTVPDFVITGKHHSPVSSQKALQSHLWYFVLVTNPLKAVGSLLALDSALDEWSQHVRQ